MTDAFTKVVELTALESKEANVVARAFFEKWVCRYTCPKVLVSDRGGEFCNDVMDKLCEFMGIERGKFHP